MKYIVLFLFLSSKIFAQGIEPTSFQGTPYKGGVLVGIIPIIDEFTGDTTYLYQHSDSLAVSIDSIYIENDTIKLKYGSGYVVINGSVDSIYLVTGATKDTIKLRDGTGYALVDKALTNGVKGIGTATRVAWWGASDSLSSSANLYWDNSNNELEIKSIPIGSNATNQLYAGSGAASGATNATGSNIFGVGAGTGATNASNSNIFGTNAGYSAVGGALSNFFGLQAGAFATNAYYSNYFGVNAGYGATNAFFSNFFGPNTGLNATNASSSNFFGNSAGSGATGASSSNFFGNNAGNGATNANSSNFFGNDAGRSATGALNSNFFGVSSGQNASAAQYANFFGNSAGLNATNASSSNFFGLNTGNGATNASYSNFFGQQAGLFATNAYFSNFFGRNAGESASNASYSNFFGDNTGSPGLGTNNILIGKSVTLPDGTANSMNIGSVIFGTGFWNSATKNSTGSTGGKIGLITNSPIRTLDVNGEVRIRDLITDDPIYVVGADGDGDLGRITVGNGLNLSSSTLSGTRLNIGGVYYSGDLSFGTGTTGTYPSWTYSSGVMYYNLPSGSSGQVLKHNGTGWAAGTDNTGGVTGSGTTNYISKWSSSTALTNSTIQDNGSTIGVGVSPDASYRFKVGSGNVKIGDASPGSLNKIYFGDGEFVYIGEDVSDDRLYLKGTALTVNINGSVGSSGQVLMSNGSTSSWQTVNVNDADSNPTNEAQTLSFNSSTKTVSLNAVSGVGGGSAAIDYMRFFNGSGLPYSTSENGIMRSTEATNGPNSSHHTVFNSMMDDGNYGFQIAGANGDDIWYRNKGTTFGSWNQFASRSWVTSQGYLTSEVDGNPNNELQTYSHSGTTSYTNTLSNGGGSFTIAAGSGTGVSHSSGTATISLNMAYAGLTNPSGLITSTPTYINYGSTTPSNGYSASTSTELITAGTGGVTEINFYASFFGNDGPVDITCSLYIDGVEDTNTIARGRVDDAGYDNISFTAIKSSVGTIGVKCSNVSDPFSLIDIQKSTLTAKKIGN